MTLEKLKKLLADGTVTQEEFDELAKNAKNAPAAEDKTEPKPDDAEPPKENEPVDYDKLDKIIQLIADWRNTREQKIYLSILKGILDPINGALKCHINDVSGGANTAASISDAATLDTKQLFKVVENTEIMRLQLIFDNKPSVQIREILKKNGFKWSPTNSAWQRQLTDNAKRSLKRIVEELHI